MSDVVTFQTRARTIDHLGREQIADVPTAVSELWKNAYDAYARDVALHIYGDHNPTAAIFDDGHGMDRNMFIDRWLVVGTESKVGPNTVAPQHRNGLHERPKQGQKGIGRLSVAALGSAVLVVSKRADSNFTACLIDWRLFENPFLYLHDIRVPVVEFTYASELAELLPGMREALRENLTGFAGPEDRQNRIKAAWNSFDLVERDLDIDAEPTSTRIFNAAGIASLNEAYLSDWAVWTGQRPSGTALVIADINYALAAWVLEGDVEGTEEVESIKASLTRTLTGFSDPYVEASDDSMDYRVVVHARDGERTVVGRDEGYGIGFLRSLDHCLEGEIDELGIFRGRIRAFGKDLGPIELLPSLRPPTKSRDRVGPFSIKIGAFEVVQRSSTLTPEIHTRVLERAQTHSGLSIYRDGLRVMPYGRPENDFFKIEERRQFHAGREFWASRRLFGAIEISREQNPNLRDKAGREGFIDNTASRAMQLLVIDLLKITARRYFGYDAPVRGELLPTIEAENDAAAANRVLKNVG